MGSQGLFGSVKNIVIDIEETWQFGSATPDGHGAKLGSTEYTEIGESQDQTMHISHSCQDDSPRIEIESSGDRRCQGAPFIGETIPD